MRLWLSETQAKVHSPFRTTDEAFAKLLKAPCEGLLADPEAPDEDLTLPCRAAQ